MPTTIDLGQKIKAKFPGTYDDLSDAEVGAKVKTKFPGAYDDFMDAPTQPAQPQQPQSLLDRTGGVATSLLDGATEVVKGIGKGALSTVKGAANLGEQGLSYATGGGRLPETSFNSLQGQAEKGLNMQPGQLTTPQNTAQSIGKGAEQLGEFLIPGSAATKFGKAAEAAKILENSPKLRSLASFFVKNGAEGLIGAGQQAVQQGNTDNFGTNALTMGGLSVGGDVLSATGRALTQKLPGRLVDSALKPPTTDLKKSIKYGQSTLGDELAQRGIFGTDKQIFAKSSKNLEKLDDQLTTILSSPQHEGVRISKSELSKYLEPVVSDLSKTPGKGDEINTVVKVLNDIPENGLTLPEANEMKRKLYGELTDKAYALDPALSTKKDSMKAVAKGIKKEIENKTAGTVGEGVVRKINQDLAVHGKAADRALTNIATKEKSNILPSVYKLLPVAAGAVGGGAYGAGTGDSIFKNALLGAAITGVGGSTFGKTLAATALSKSGNLVSKLPTKAIGKMSKAEIMKGMSRALGSK